MAEEPAPEAEKPEGEEEDQEPLEPVVNRGVDAFSCEFIYYGSVLKIITQTLSNESDRQRVMPWVKKLFQPEYQTTTLREKRNKYLAKLIINVLNDEAVGVFSNQPPKGALEELKKIRIEEAAAAEWELDKMWQEVLLGLPDSYTLPPCNTHASPEECRSEVDKHEDKFLDMLFQYMLYLVRPYAAMLPPDDRTRISSWLQLLCAIHGKYFCTTMKGIRNDYIFCLLGYLHDLRIVGPFMEFPTSNIVPLPEALANSRKKYRVTDPEAPEVNEFLKDMPIPDDGAFCYIALTGDIIASNLS